MATQRCLNDMFGGICKGTPQVNASTDISFSIGGGTPYPSHTSQKCSLNLKTCGFFVPFSQVVKPIENLGTGVRLISTGVQTTTLTKKKKKQKEEALGEQVTLL